MTNLNSILESRNIVLLIKIHIVKTMAFFSSHVQVDHKEHWQPKNWCFWTVVLEKTLESPLDCKEIQPVHSEGDQSWVFIGRTDAKGETPVLWPPHGKTDSLEKTLMLRKVEDRRRRGWQRMRWLDGIIDSIDMNLSNLREIVKDRKVWCATVHGLTNS